jgi:hypothetical protein
MLTSAAPPVITQLNGVFLARPIPIDITLKAMKAVPPKTSSGTRPLRNAGAVSTRTIRARAAGMSDIQQER